MTEILDPPETKKDEEITDDEDVALLVLSEFEGICEREGYLRDDFAIVYGELKQILLENVRKSGQDSLTGLLNYRAFLSSLSREISRSSRSGSSFLLGMIDLDDFKRFNSIHGHEGGDKVLKYVTARLRESTRDEDYVARRRGDEFEYILVKTDYERGLAVPKRIRERMQEELEIAPGRKIVVTGSQGIVSYSSTEAEEITSQYGSIKELADRLNIAANAALHRAKRDGKTGIYAWVGRRYPSHIDEVKEEDVINVV